MKKLISLCMIVKNEEDVLERCLNSIKDWVGEIVIVDTGSTDLTKEIAGRYTDKIIDFPWCDDFSAARNAALEHATGDWILHLDADEYMEPIKLDIMEQALQPYLNNQPIGFELPIYNLLDRTAATQLLVSSNVRLFANHPKVRYSRPIHELVFYQGKTIPYTQLPFKIYHTGYQSDISENKQKNERNLAIFHKFKREGSLEPIDYFYLGNEYFTLGQMDKAAYYFKRAFEFRKKKLYPWISHTAVRYINVLLAMDHKREALQVTNECIALWPQFPDFYCYKARILGHLGLEDEALALNMQCLKLAENLAQKQNTYWLISPEYGASVPYEQMASVYAAQLNFREQVTCLSKLVQMNPYSGRHWYSLLLVLVSRESADAVIQLIDRFAVAQDAAFYRQILQVAFLLKNTAISVYASQRLIALQEPLTNFETLFLAVLRGDPAAYQDNWNGLDTTARKNTELQEPVWLAALVFNNDKRIDLLTFDSLKAEIATHFFDAEASKSPPPWNEKVIPTLKSLLLMGHIDVYNSLFERYAAYEVKLSNALADFLFDYGDYESAFTYYVKLMDLNELQLDGYLRLVRNNLFYIKDYDTARQLAEEAVSRYPDCVALYYYLIRYLSEGTDREHWQIRLKKSASTWSGFQEMKSLLHA